MKKILALFLALLLTGAFSALAELSVDEAPLPIEGVEFVGELDALLPEEVEIPEDGYLPGDGSFPGDVLPNDMAISANDSSDFVIKDGVLTAYRGEWSEVVIPDTVTAIGKGAFEGSFITSVVIPGSVTSVGKRAFAACAALEKVVFKSGSGCEIGDEAFCDCAALQTLTLKGVTSIGAKAFWGCGACSVDIPDTVTAIGAKAFMNSSVTSAVIPGSVAAIPSEAFSTCYGLAKVTLKEGISSIDARAFAYCGSLTSLTIPDSVAAIGKNAFQDCWALEKVTILGEDALEVALHATAFSSTNIDRHRIRYPDAPDFYTRDDTLLMYTGGAGKVTIPEGITKIGREAFMYREDITSVVIPSGVTAIGGSAFLDCSGMTSITIPESVTAIGDHAFENCNRLKSIRLPSKLKKLPNDVFSSCDSLTTVVIPASVTAIGAHCFQPCANLKTVVLSEGLKTLGGHAFAMCYSLEAVTLPTTLTSLPSDTFQESGKVVVSVYEGSRAAYDARFLDDYRKIVVLPASAAERTYQLSESTRGKTVKLAVGDTLRIQTPWDTAKKYESSDRKVATVSKKGLVTVRGKGTATITATMIDGIRHTLKLKVAKAARPTGISLSQGASLTLAPGAKIRLNAVLKPANARSALTWTSSKKAVCKVSSGGVVTALKKGTAKITVKCKAGGKKAAITVKVR